MICSNGIACDSCVVVWKTSLHGDGIVVLFWFISRIREYSVGKGEASGLINALGMGSSVIDVPVDILTKGMADEVSYLSRSHNLILWTSQDL